MLTYIEFFDKNAAENISACLTCAPDRVIYIGDDSKLIKKHIKNYERVFTDRGNRIEFLYRTVSKNNLDKVVALLVELVESYDDCVFDITGGEETYTLALGIVRARYPDKNIHIQKFNPNNNAVYNYDKDATIVCKHTPELSVIENVRIYGGDVVYGDISEEKTYKWDLNRDFINDINIMWSVCKRNVRYWNTVISAFEAMEKVAKSVCDENSLTTIVKKSELEEYFHRNKMKYKISRGIIDFLLKYNLLKAFDDGDKETIIVSYKNEQVKKCLTKAGQALEMKIYITAKNILDSDGTPVYDDAVNGAVIDWDGDFHDEAVEKEYDTENEIDIILMHDTVPVFISCKNGIVTSDELYKLNTVAQRFGGAHAKKILVATAISSLGKAGNYLKQRAEDMNIKILEDVQHLEDKELERRLKNLWRG